MKKILAMCMVCAIAVSVAAGCTPKSNQSSGETITITVGNWPTDNRPNDVALYEERVAKMKELYPNIEIVPDQWAYSVDSFLPKASSGQLPTIYNTWFTEIQKIIDAGYAKDITEKLEEYGFNEGVNPAAMELMSKDGRSYCIPDNMYAMGLAANINLFTEAGLVNEDGTVMYPETYEQLAEYAQQIKQKTGKAGFMLPTLNNIGGWHFMNIAWSYGVNFMEQQDGKWTATFNTDEAVAALQYVKDLKWKYNVLPDNNLIDSAEVAQMFATDQGAMYFDAPPANTLVQLYNMEKDNISFGTLPAGPAGRYTQIGGAVNMISPDATDEQVDACFKWMEVCGVTPHVTDEIRQSREEAYQADVANGNIVGVKPYSIWVSPERVQLEDELLEKYKNVDTKHFDVYSRFENVIIRAEEPVSAQELYKILDACIQDVLTNENADCKAIIEKANSDFQKNYLDNLQ